MHIKQHNWTSQLCSHHTRKYHLRSQHNKLLMCPHKYSLQHGSVLLISIPGTCFHLYSATLIRKHGTYHLLVPVHLSVTLLNCIQWLKISSAFFTSQVALSFYFWSPNAATQFQEEHPHWACLTNMGSETFAVFTQYLTLSWKRYRIGP